MTEPIWEVRPRMSGATRDLIQWMREAPPGEVRIYVAHRHDAARKMWTSYADEFESWQFRSIDQVLRGQCDFPGAGELQVVFGIDNADLCLQALLGGTIGKAMVSQNTVAEFAS